MYRVLFGSSVELSVYLDRGSPHNLCTNKQYPTLAVIYFGAVYDNASDEWSLLIPVLM